MNRLEKLLKKYWFQIIWIILMSLILFIFVPSQESFYWNSDVALFKENYYVRISIGISLFLILLILIKSILKKERINQILKQTIGVTIFCTWFFFFFQSIIISIILLINRSNENQTIDREFQVIRIDDNKYIFAKEIGNNEFIIEQSDYEKHPNYKNINKLVKGEIIHLPFKKGLFDINYFEK